MHTGRKLAGLQGACSPGRGTAGQLRSTGPCCPAQCPVRPGAAHYARAAQLRFWTRSVHAGGRKKTLVALCPQVLEPT